MSYRIRRALAGRTFLEDRSSIGKLYRLVALESGGLARRPIEVTDEFLEGLLRDTQRSGLMLLLEGEESEEVMGVIHAAHGDILDLRHVMGHLTLLLHPKIRGQGLGKRLFREFLAEIESSFRFVFRVELRARASNVQALELYEDLGFVREGTFKARIQTRDGGFEDGVPMAWFNPGWQSPS